MLEALKNVFSESPVVEDTNLEKVEEGEHSGCIVLDDEVAGDDVRIQVPSKYFPSRVKPKQGINQAIELSLIIVMWYICSSFANNFNKSILSDNIFPYPMTLTMYQFGFISICCMFLFKVFPSQFKRQNLKWNLFLEGVLPLCLSQICAHLLTQISIQQVPVSFTHTVKATSPIFTILISIYYGFDERYPPLLLFSIVPIISGVALCTFSEINYTMIGFVAALGSTIVFSWQNAFSKKVFKDHDELDHVNLLFYISSISFGMMMIPWFFIDLPRFSIFDPNASSISDNPNGLAVVLGLFLFNGICHFGQNITAFSFLTKVTPLTYTIFNTFKRIFVIISAIMYFGNDVNIANGTGIGLAILGVAMYNKAKLDVLSQ